MLLIEQQQLEEEEEEVVMMVMLAVKKMTTMETNFDPLEGPKTVNPEALVSRAVLSPREACENATAMGIQWY
jgi:hypothetical protein